MTSSTGSDTAMFQPYPETILELEQGVIRCAVSQPSRRQVVMGAAGRVHHEVYPERLQNLGIPLYKRKGGGGTVLLGPNTLVVTIHAGVAHRFRNQSYFGAINEALMTVFHEWRPLPYHQRGLSDIAHKDRKIVGSSMFRRRNSLLYQASILVELDLEIMDQVLRHPPREPDYRRGRNHADFVTCLRDLGVEKSYETMATELDTRLTELLPNLLARVDQSPTSG